MCSHVHCCERLGFVLACLAQQATTLTEVPYKLPNTQAPSVCYKQYTPSSCEHKQDVCFSVAKAARAACLLLIILSLYLTFSITFCLNTDRDSSRVPQRSYLYPSPSFTTVSPISQSPFTTVPPISKPLLYPSPSFTTVLPISQSLLYPSPSYIPVPPLSQSLLYPSPSYIPVPPLPQPSYIPVSPIFQSLLYPSPFACPPCSASSFFIAATPNSKSLQNKSPTATVLRTKLF